MGKAFVEGQYFCAEEKKTENEKEQNIVKKDKFALVDGLKALQVVLADLKSSTVNTC